MPEQRSIEKADVKRPEVLPPAPPEEKVIDEALVDRAVKRIQEVEVKARRDAIIEVGKYILDEFYGGDAEAVRSKSPKKAKSLSALEERCEKLDIGVSRSWLYNAVAVALLHKELPEVTALKQLPATHQATLLPLRDQPQALEELAKKALDGDLSVSDLRKRVRKAAPRQKGSPGRPETPPVVKALDGALRLFRPGSRLEFTEKDVERLSSKRGPGALLTAKALLDDLRQLVSWLKRVHGKPVAAKPQRKRRKGRK